MSTQTFAELGYEAFDDRVALLPRRKQRRNIQLVNDARHAAIYATGERCAACELLEFDVCYKCHGEGRVSGGSGQGAWGGTCFRCLGKGWLSVCDERRNDGYDAYRAGMRDSG